MLVKILWTWNIALLVLISFLSFIRVYVPWLWSSLRLICLLTLYCYFRSEATDICVIHFCLAVCIVDSFLAMMWGTFYVMSFMIHFLFQVIGFGRRAPFDASKILPCRLEYVGLSTTEYCFTLPRIVGELSMYCVLILSLFLYASHLWIFYFILYVFGYLWWHKIYLYILNSYPLLTLPISWLHLWCFTIPNV